MGELILAGDLLWDPFGCDGGRELCKYSTDSHDKEKDQGQDDKKQEQAGILVGAFLIVRVNRTPSFIESNFWYVCNTAEAKIRCTNIFHKICLF